MATQTLSDPGPQPPVMTWFKAAPVLAVALIFWCVRVVFEQFWLFGPMLIGFFVSQKLGGGVVGGAAGGVAAATSGYFGGPALAIFGAIMAMMIAFLGAGVLALLILFTNKRFYTENAKSFLFMIIGFAFSELPIIGTLPSIEGTVFGLYRQQIKREKERLRAWEAAQKAYQAQLRLQQRAEAAQLVAERQSAQAYEEYEEEAAAANDNAAQAPKEKITVPGEYSYEFAANNNEIPAEGKRAA